MPIQLTTSVFWGGIEYIAGQSIPGLDPAEEAGLVSSNRAFYTSGPFVNNAGVAVESFRNPLTGVIEISSGGEPVSVGGASSGDPSLIEKYHKLGGDIVLVGDSTTERVVSQYAVDGTVAWQARTLIPSREYYGIKIFNRGAGGVTAAVVATSDATSVWSAEAVATIPAGLFRVSLGINDMCTRASIAGTVYGSAAQITAAAELRSHLKTIYDKIKAQQPNACFIFSMPIGHAQTSTYFTNSVTGQNCMDVYRLAYVGDPALGIPSLEDEIQDSIVYDSQSVYSSRTSFTAGSLNGIIDPDGLHGLNEGTAIGMSLTPAFLPDIGRDGERLLCYGAQPISGESSFELVAQSEFSGNGSSYLDLTTYSPIEDGTTAAARMWGGAASSQRGSASAPVLAMGDYLVLHLESGDEWIRIARLPSGNNGGYIRWSSGHPNGGSGYPAAPVGGYKFATVLRPVFGATEQSALAKRAIPVGGINAAPYKNKRYLYAIDVSDVGSCTLRAVKDASDEYGDAEAHTLTTSDVVFAAGLSVGIAGLVLTSATIAPVADRPGAWTVTLANVDFRAPWHKQVIVCSDT